MRLADLPVRLVRPLGSDHDYNKSQPRAPERGIGRRDIKNAERRQLVYDTLLAFHNQRHPHQAAGAICDASGVKLSYCQSDLIVLRDHYQFVKSSDRVRGKQGRNWTVTSHRLWWVVSGIERKILPMGVV